MSQYPRQARMIKGLESPAIRIPLDQIAPQRAQFPEAVCHYVCPSTGWLCSAADLGGSAASGEPAPLSQR
jgi:hypothetical protein